MKNLFLKNGNYVPVVVQKLTDGRFIDIYEFPEGSTPGKLKCTIISGKSTFRQSVNFAEPQQEIAHHVILMIAEIIENFNQYFDNLNQ